MNKKLTLNLSIICTIVWGILFINNFEEYNTLESIHVLDYSTRNSLIIKGVIYGIFTILCFSIALVFYRKNYTKNKNETESENKNSLKKRPLIITIICVLGLIYAASSIPEIFSDNAVQFGAWYPSYIVLITIIDIACMIGLWHMKKWSVIVYTIKTGVAQTVFFVMWFSSFITPLILILAGFISIIIPLIIIITGFIKIGDMD